MNSIKKVELAIGIALEKNKNCPICGARIVLAGADAVQGEIYRHDCECFWESTSLQQNPNEVYGCDYGIYSYGPHEDVNNYCVYEDDEICIFDDGQLIQKSFYPDNTIRRKKTYIKHCHACKKTDGVNSNDQKCVENRPYGYKCKHCKNSLRTHDEYGEGMEFDMAKQDITWRFEGKKPMLIENPPIHIDDDDIPF